MVLEFVVISKCGVAAIYSANLIVPYESATHFLSLLKEFLSAEVLPLYFTSKFWHHLQVDSNLGFFDVSFDFEDKRKRLPTRPTPRP